MDTRRVLLVDAFATGPLTGTVAGVVPDADGLNERQMQAVAREVAASATAFVLPSDEAERGVRWFGPSTEIGRCDHATVATAGFLFEDGRIEAGTHALETNDGVLDVEVEETGRVWISQEGPEIRESDLDRERVADALGIDPAALADIGQDLPLARAATGRPVLVVPVNFLEHLTSATPDAAAVEALTEEVGVTAVYAFTFDTLDADSTAHARLFAPGGGTAGGETADEGTADDGTNVAPATGTASGACGAYLRRYGAFDIVPEEMRFEQGHVLDRPARVHVRASGAVQVGGHAVTALDGRIVVPTREPDDIVEA